MGLVPKGVSTSTKPKKTPRKIFYSGTLASHHPHYKSLKPFRSQPSQLTRPLLNLLFTNTIPMFFWQSNSARRPRNPMSDLNLRIGSAVGTLNDGISIESLAPTLTVYPEFCQLWRRRRTVPLNRAWRRICFRRVCKS